MKHPNKKQRQNQENFLSQLPEEDREEHARLFRFGNASYIYYQEAEDLEPTETDFEEWLTGLPENMRDGMKERGFESCKSVLSFSRYVMEKNDIGMKEWMKNHLSEDDFKEWENLIETRKKIDP
tara:strand:+ start:3638 stop:4009 length:372 start_codon:yes stop_codon:yes gene_type:complete